MTYFICNLSAVFLFASYCDILVCHKFAFLLFVEMHKNDVFSQYHNLNKGLLEVITKFNTFNIWLNRSCQKPSRVDMNEHCQIIFFRRWTRLKTVKLIIFCC